MSTVKKLMIGMAVGAALGVLFAPAKGSKTRRRLARKGNKIRESWCEFKDTIAGTIENIRGEVDELADKAEENIAQSPNPEQWRAT
jgi:gas vesicle protein